MSRTAERWVDEKSTARGTARLVLRYLAGRYNASRGYAWPRIDTIAADLRIPARTVRYNLRRLVELGELEVNRTGRSSLYRLPQLPQLEAVPTPASDPVPTAASAAASCRSDRQKLPITALLIGNPPRGYPWGVGSAAVGASPAGLGADRGPSDSCRRHQRRRRTCDACQSLPVAGPPKVVRPPWCGECDEVIRQRAGDGGYYRCPDCHPLTVGVPA